MGFVFNTIIFFRKGLPVIACYLFSLHVCAQEEKTRWLLGTGITYCSYIDNPGLNLNVTYRVAGNLHIGPDFSALLTREKKENGSVVKRKELEYNFNANYLMRITSCATTYPLVGINWSKVTNHPAGQENDTRWITGFNVGGGLEFNVKTIRLFMEGKWVSNLNKYDVTAGLLFEL